LVNFAIITTTLARYQLIIPVPVTIGSERSSLFQPKTIAALTGINQPLCHKTQKAHYYAPFVFYEPKK
jgi:hypothetical protein